MSGGWNTIESDAGVFTFLLESLGVSNVEFEELLSLEPEALRPLNPIGVIFLFKYPTGETAAEGTGAGDRPADGELDHDALEPSADGEEPVWFAAQTIQNACGTQALLSVLLNQRDPDPDTDTDSDSATNPTVSLGPALREFKEFTAGFPAELRGEALSNSDVIRDAHNSFARSSPFASDESSRAAAGPDDDEIYHFVAYTSVRDTLYELDGLRGAPVRHGDVGACPRELLADAVVPVLHRRIARYPASEIRFNLLAMCEDARTRARAAGDAEGLAREERKRAGWRWENALRRHNFVGFIAELMKGVVAARLRDGTYDAWLAGARDATRKRVEGEEARRRGREAEASAMDLS